MSMSAMEIQQIAIITVSYNAPDLIADLLKSLRRFYSNKVYIIDGSEAGRVPAIAAVAAGYADVDFIHFDYNIHHGPGMAWALTQLDLAGPVLVIDSDVEVLHAGFLESLAAELTPQMYGVGQLNYVNRGGFDVAGYDQPKPPDTVTYLHPALMLCNIAVVRQWPMPVKHGAPMIPTMTAIHDAGRTDLLHHVEWVRADFAVPSAHRYIRHDWQGTVGRTGGYHLEEWQAQVIAEHQQALAARADTAPASAAAPPVASADLSTVLLSICIPTFNRAPFLAQTLASITAQAAFTGSSNVEVVVSDNWSSDDTAAVVARFVEAFPGKVRYTRPAQAVPADVNFGLVLEHGQGTFLKLHNDNLMIRDGSLAEILKVIQATSAEQPVLFFTNGNQHAGQPIEVAANLSDFVRRASYFSTWIGGFGIWRSQFAAMPDFARHADLQLVQTDVLLRLVGAGKRAIILFDAYFAGLNTGKKGGYNIAKVFGHNYLSLLKPYVAAGLLDDTVYQEEKKQILLKHIIPFYFDAGNGFLKDGFFEHMQDYLHEPYFHAAMEQLLGKAQQAAPAVQAPAVAPTQKELLRAYWDQVKAQWRADNAHNETSLQRIHGRLQPGQISVGRKSYGPLTVWIYGGADEALRIGNFVSIADGVTFLLGGDHGYGALSTFPFRAKYFGSPDAQGKGPVTVDDDVWIGYNSTILSGVHIGQGAVIAAGSMVTKDVAPYSVVGGNPAKLIKYRFAPEVITALLGFDFSTLSDAAILRSRELLYTALTAENVHAVLAQLRAAGAGLN